MKTQERTTSASSSSSSSSTSTDLLQLSTSSSSSSSSSSSQPHFKSLPFPSATLSCQPTHPLPPPLPSSSCSSCFKSYQPTVTELAEAPKPSELHQHSYSLSQPHLPTTKATVQQPIHQQVECPTSPATPLDPLIGTTIISPSPHRTHYSLTRILGQGSFSKVFRAHLLNQHNTQPIHSVALKLIQIHSTTSNTNAVHHHLITQDQMPTDEAENVRMSTLREIEILKSINHPTVIKLIESFATTNESTNLIKKNSSLQIIVLEELRGGELFELVSKFKSTLRPLIMCRLMAELCISIHWLHQHDIVHRDLKLENILLVREIKNTQEEEREILTSPNVYLKVTDFGLSVKLTKSDDPKHSTESGMRFLQSRCGSEEYAAPEIILGREYDGTKTDAWALGVIGYSLVMGFLPFKLPQRRGVEDGEEHRGNLSSHPTEHEEEESEQAFLKKRKQGLLKIIKSEYRWKSNNPHNHLNQNQMASSDDHQLVQGQIRLVDRLLVRDPLKRSNDVLFGFRDPTWLGRFNWLKESLLASSSSS